MSYHDIAYLNMPSFWSEYFLDKKILDYMFEASLDIASQSYSDMLREFSSQSIYNQDKYSSEDWHLLKVEKSWVTTLTIGQDTYEIAPIDSPIIGSMFVSSKPNLSIAATVYSPDSVRIVPYISDCQSLLSRIGLDTRLVGKPKLLLAKNSYIFSSKEFIDGTEFTYEVTKYCVLAVTKSFLYTELYSAIANSEQLVEVEVDGVVYSVIATRSESYLGKAYVYLDTRISLPLGNSCYIKSGQHRYRADILGTTLSEVTLNIWCRKAFIDYKSFYFKFGSGIFDSTLLSTSNSRDLIKAFRQLAVTGPSSTNFKRAIATSYGSSLISTGEALNEQVISVDLDTGRIVTNTEVYDHARPFSINKKILLRSGKILINGKQTPKTLTYLLALTSSGPSTISSLISSLFSESDIVAIDQIYGIPEYSNIFRINNSIHGSILAIGRDYIVIKTTSSITTISNLSVVESTNGAVKYSFSQPSLVKAFKLNQINPDEPEVVLWDTTLSTIDVFSPNTDSSNSYLGTYLPESIYNTTYLRRKIALDSYNNIVGEMPLHVVGDYGIQVSEARTYKSSAYYIFQDFIINNSFYVSYSNIDLSLGLIPDNIDSISKLYMPSGSVVLHKETNSLISSLDVTLLDSISKNIAIGLDDEIPSVSLAPELLVGDYTNYQKYLHFYFDQDVPQLGSNEILYGSTPLEYVYIDAYPRLVEVLLTQDAPSDIFSDYSINGLAPIDMVKVTSVGGYNSLLGSGTPLVGSGLPVLSKKANSIFNQGKLSDVGPFITIS